MSQQLAFTSFPFIVNNLPDIRSNTIRDNAASFNKTDINKNTDCTASNSRISATDYLQKRLKGELMLCRKVLIQHLLGMNKGRYKPRINNLDI